VSERAVASIAALLADSARPAGEANVWVILVVFAAIALVVAGVTVLLARIRRR